MRSTWSIRAVRAVTALVVLGSAVGASAAAAKPVRPIKARALNLFAAAGLLYQVNEQQCGLDNFGEICVSFAGSPVGGGGFWPKGTVDQYIFNSGFQMAAVIQGVSPFAAVPGVSLAPAGDTAGIYFFDARGDQENGVGLTGVFDALNPADLAAWPNGGIVRDASIYSPILLNGKTVSQGDAWVRYWDGDPAFVTGRKHPLGVVVDQRTLAWNFPSGNEAIIYFIFTFYNVTAKSSSGKYQNATIPVELQGEIGQIGDQFHALNDARYKITLPDTGYTFHDAFAAFSMDADVAVFSQNYATAILPFNIGMEYSGTFLPDAGWTFPPALFGAPFFPAVGFIGVKYLRSPVNPATGKQVGLTMFSQTFNPNNPTGLKDPFGTEQLYRYLSGFLGPSDVQCGGGSPFTGQAARDHHICFLGTSQGDARFFQSSGPFDLPPGQSGSIVVAYINAAPVDTVKTYVGGDLTPGFPATGDSIFKNPSVVRLIDRIAGWKSQADLNGNGIIEQDEVTTVPRSLLDKALVAQAVFDKGFLLPSAPAAPNFFLVPGNNQVTVVWQASATEKSGDPFYAIASLDSVPDPTNPLKKVPNALFDPDFRQFDVEGYRIYRGRTSSELELVAQFDYAGTFFRDFTGQIDYAQDLNGDGLIQCAPELGLQADCPVTFDGKNFFDTPLAGHVVQIPPGGRVQLASGNVLNLKADTAVTNQQCVNVRCPPLTDGGVPFAFVDAGVLNSFTYLYAVTAFDLNSIKSGPTSLESPRVTKRVTPRRSSAQEVGASVSAVKLLGGAGQVLDPSAPIPTLSGTTAIFSGPMPPADGIQSSLAAFVPQLITGGTVTITIDSVLPGHADEQDAVGPLAPARYFVSAAGPTGTTTVTIPLTLSGFSGDASTIAYVPVTALDSAKAVPFKGNQTYALYSSVGLSSPGTWRLTSWGRADRNSDPSRSYENGPRWWAGAANENTPRPNSGVCAPADGGCVDVVFNNGTNTKNAGSISGVLIFHPQSYSTVNSFPMRDAEAVLSTVTRAADFDVYWGANGAIDSVMDVTHKIAVPFNAKIRAGWGILNDSSFVNTNQATTPDGKNGLLTWSDITCVDPILTFITQCGDVAQTPAFLMNHARLSPIAMTSIAFSSTNTLTTTGNGFIFYLNGHFFLMQMAAFQPAGTVWHARFYSGNLRFNAALTSLTFRCGFNIGVSCVRPAAVPGLRAQFTFQGSTFTPSVTSDSLLARVHTVPDPYYVANALEITANQKILKFVNLPMQCIIRLYSLSGILVQVIPHDDPTGGGEETWNLRNRNNQFVASGVYFYHIETPDGKTKVGRFTIVNFAP